MKIKDIEIANISRFRGELMGMAMLFVILFHVSLPQSDAFFGLRRIGNIGVDIFLFLSGIGLWFSWTKTDCGLKKKTCAFYLKRIVRIYPAWILMATLFYLPDYLSVRHYSKSVVDLLGDILVNWDFWLHDELTFWYIPATMMLYLFAPPYMELIKRHPIYRWMPVLMIMWCILVQWVTPIHNTVGHLEIFWSRVPIFFIGINLGDSVKNRQTLDGTSLWMIIAMFAMALACSIFMEQNIHGRFPLFIERMLYIPLTVTSILLLNRLFRRTPQWFNATFRVIGTLSLEAYLIHYHFVLVYVERLNLGYWLSFLLCVAATLPLAWLLHNGIGVATKFVCKKKT